MVLEPEIECHAHQIPALAPPVFHPQRLPRRSIPKLCSPKACGFRTVFALPTDQLSCIRVCAPGSMKTGVPWGAVGRPTASVSLDGGRLSDSTVERVQFEQGLTLAAP